MTGRRQLVQVGTEKSNEVSVPYGVPQGGGLSPLLFIIFTSDMEEACTEAMTLTYADDTSASVMGKDPEEVCAKLEATSLEVMDYMAANGMAPNEKKTEFMVFQKEKSGNIKVGNSGVQEAEEV
jgi:retron-type reverse transcriptase